MATVDRLDIQIEGSVKKANEAIDSLITNLNKLANSLKIDTSNLEKIGKSLNINGIDKSAKSMQSQMQKVSKSLSQITEQYKDLGKGFEIKGSTQQIQKQINSLTNQLAKAKLAKEDFEMSEKTNLGGYETAVKNVIKYTNQIESLKKQLSEMQSTQPKIDLDVSGMEGRKKYIIEYKKELIDFKKDIQSISDTYGGLKNAPKGTFDTPIENLKISIQELKRDYPQATEVIAMFEKEFQRLKEISSKLTKEPTRPKIDTSSLSGVNERITELAKRFENLGKDFKFTGNFEQLNIEIEKAYSKLQELGLKEQEMLSAGKINTSDFEKLQASLTETGNKLDVMENLRDRTEAFNQSLKNLVVPPIHEENLTKLQNALRKTEEDTEKLKAKLYNLTITRKIIPNIDNSTFKDLTIKISESEKYAEALRKKIQDVGSQSNTASSSANALGKNIKNLSSSMRGLGTSAGKAITGMKSFARQALASMGIYLGVFGMVRGLKNSIINSMNYIENLNYFNKAFEQVAKKADLKSFEQMGYDSAEAYYNSFSKRAEELTAKMTGFSVGKNGRLEATGMQNLGINPTTLMNYQATFAQMSSSMGTTSENALLLSDVLTKIGADLASVKNMSFEKVWNDMASGLAGMSRTLDKYGANIRNVNLQQKLNEIGIKENISALNQNDKALLRTIILLDSTKYAWGDLSRTLDQPANQLRLLKSNFSNLGRSIGNIFLPIFSKVIPYVNAAVIALQRLADWLVKVFGFEGFEWGGIGNASFDISQIYDDTENLSDGLDTATDKAKGLKNELMGFDEINKLSDDTDSTSANSALGIGNGILDEALKKSVSEYQKAWDKAFEGVENRSQKFADNIENAFKSGDFKGIGTYISEKLSNALDSINWDLIYQGARNFGTGLADFLNGLITPDLFGNVGKTIAGFLNTKVYAALSFGQTFDFTNLGESIAAGVNNFFATFDFGSLAETINVWVKGLLNSIISTFDNIDWGIIGEQIGTFLANIDLFEIGVKAVQILWKGINSGFDLFIGTFKKAPLETTILSLATLPKLLKIIVASKFIKGLKNLANGIKLTSMALAGNKASNALLITQYPKLGKAIEVARKAFANFRFGIENGNYFTGLNEGIKTVRNNLTGLQKGVITAVAGFVEFKIISGTFEGLVSGSENIVSGIGKIGAAAGIAATAMYTALGPAGLAIASVVGVVGAVKGINDAFDAIRAQEIGESIKNAMSTPGGIPLSEITSNFANALSEAASGFDTIKEKSSEMDNVQNNIEDTWIEIYKIQEAMENGVLSVEEGKAQLETLFSELATLTEQKFSTMNTVIMSAYGEGGSFRTVLDNLGLDTEAAIDTMITYGYQNSQRAKEIAQELVGMDINSEEYKALIAELASLTGEMDKFEQATSNFTYDMNSLQGKIDYSEIFPEDGSIDTEALQRYLDEAATALSDYEISLDDAGKEISQYWQEIYNSTTATDEQRAVAKANLDYIPQAIESMKTNAELQIVGFTDMIQTEFISRTGNIIEDAQKKWNEKSDWNKFWGGVFGAGTKEEYIKEAVDKQQKNVDKLSAAIEESFGNLKIKGAGWGSDAAKEIYNSLFSIEKNDAIISYNTYTLRNDWKEILEKATEGLEKDANERGKESILGYINAFLDNNNVKNVVSTINDFVGKAMESWAFAQDSHSPSKVTEKLGKYAIDGYNLGILNNQKTTIDEINKYINNIISIFYKNQSPMKEAGENIINGIYQGLENAEKQLYEKVNNISNNIIGGIKNVLKIHSPSKVMFELGDYTMQGLQNGLENLYHPILSSVKNFSYDLKSASTFSAESIYENKKYFNAIEYIPQYSGIDSFQEDYRQEYIETNTLLRELLYVVREGKTIKLNGREIGREIQKEDNSYFIRTGRGMFQH